MSSDSTKSSSQLSHSQDKVVFQDMPCLNCGRYGIIFGQLICSADNSTFCSADCGWSYYLRDMDRQYAIKNATQAAIANITTTTTTTTCAPLRRQHSRRTARTSRRSNQPTLHRSSNQSSRNDTQPEARRVATQQNAKSTARRPPRHPHAGDTSNASHPTEFAYCGDAMFEFSMMFHTDD